MTGTGISVIWNVLEKRLKCTAMNLLRIAAATGFLAVALGAFGAHGLEPLLKRNGTLEIWHTAVLYHLVHAAVLLAVAVWVRSFVAPDSARTAFWLFVVGIVIFSGSLYVLAITNIRPLGAVTPIGGVSLLLGWLWLALKG